MKLWHNHDFGFLLMAILFTSCMTSCLSLSLSLTNQTISLIN